MLASAIVTSEQVIMSVAEFMKLLKTLCRSLMLMDLTFIESTNRSLVQAVLLMYQFLPHLRYMDVLWCPKSQ